MRAAATSCAPPRARCRRRAICSRSRGSGWIRQAAPLPRGLKANTHAHFRRFTAASAKLTLRVLHGQISQADHRLTVCGERLGLSARSLLRQRRDRFAGLEVRLRASKLSNAQAQRNAIARQRERTHRLAERAQRALVTLLQRFDARVENSGKLLSALSYRGVLARGFALVRDEAGHPVHSADSDRTRRTRRDRVRGWTCGRDGGCGSAGAGGQARAGAAEGRGAGGQAGAEARGQAGGSGQFVLGAMSGAHILAVIPAKARNPVRRGIYQLRAISVSDDQSSPITPWVMGQLAPGTTPYVDARSTRLVSASVATYRQDNPASIVVQKPQWSGASSASRRGLRTGRPRR